MPSSVSETADLQCPLSPSGRADGKLIVCVACSSVVPHTAHRAVMLGHLHCMRASVRRGAKKVSRDGDTLLHVATKHARTELVRWIIGNYSDLKVWDTNSKGNTALHCAMDSGNVECVKAVMSGLSARHANLVTDAVRNLLYQANNSGMTPFLIAVSKNHVELVTFLLQHFGGQLPGVVNNKVGGATAFHYAAAVGSVPILTQLYKYFPKLATLCVPQTGKLPIHLAVHTGHLEAAKYLDSVTEHGLCTRSADGLNCFNQAVMNGHLGCLKWMFNECCHGEEDMAATIRQVDSEQATLFHFAAAYGETKAMQLLLNCLQDKSFAVNARDVWQRTPLHDAAEKNHLNCMKLLLAAGADIFATDKEGNTPYALAVQHDKLKTYIERHMSDCNVPEHVKLTAGPVGRESPQSSAGTIPVDAKTTTATPVSSTISTARSESPETAAVDKDKEDEMDSPLARGVDYRTSRRFRAKKTKPEILAEGTATGSTIAPQHVYEAVVVSTDDNADDDDESASATPSPPPPAEEASSPNARRRPLPSLPGLAVGGGGAPPLLAGAYTPPPSHRSLSANDDDTLRVSTEHGRDRSRSTSDVFVMASVPSFPSIDKQQPPVKIIYACSLAERMNSEVQKLAYSMEMVGVKVSITRVRKETFPSLKIRNAASLLRWLEQEKEGFECVLLVCSTKLKELFESALWGGKQPKRPSSKDGARPVDQPERSLTLPRELRVTMVPIVLLHGGSSRFCPAWLRPNQCFYWPKNQPALFNKLGVACPSQTLSLPTCRLRSNTT